MQCSDRIHRIHKLVNIHNEIASVKVDRLAYIMGLTVYVIRFAVLVQCMSVALSVALVLCRLRDELVVGSDQGGEFMGALWSVYSGG